MRRINGRNKSMNELVKKLWEQKHYKDILFFLDIYQYQEKGLEQKHFRYFLMDCPGIEFPKELQQFYKKNHLLFKRCPPQKGNIKTEDDLDQYLRRLVNWGVIERVNQKKPFRYMLTKQYAESYKNMRLEEYLQRWAFNEQRQILPFTSKDEYWGEAIIYGLSKQLKLTKEDEQKISECIGAICKNLNKILVLKTKKKKKENVSEKMKSIDFFYHGSLE